ncbi:MAG: oligosaccharide flippase family protein [Candidatus Aminicenantales bacterium]
MKDTSRATTRDIFVLARGAGMVFAGTLFGLSLKYLFQLIVARHLGAALFGAFFLGMSVFTILERVSCVSLHHGMMRFVSLLSGRRDSEGVKGTILFGLRAGSVSALVLLVVTVLLSRTLALDVFHDRNLIWVLRMMAVGGAFSGLTEILIMATQGVQVMEGKVTVRYVLEPVLRILLVLAAFGIGWRLFGAALSVAVASVCGTAAAYAFVRKVIPAFREKTIRPRFVSREILSFCWPLFFVSLLNLAMLHLSTLLLGYFRPSDEVGIYGAAFRTALLMSIILDSFNAIFPPIIADMVGKEEFRKVEQLFKIVTKWIVTLAIPVFVILALFPGMILDIWGKEFVPGALSLVLIGCAQLINCAVGSSGYMLMMTGHTKTILANGLALITLILGLGWVLIPRHGFLGAALSYSAAVAGVNILRLVEVWVILKMHPYRRDFVKPVAAGAAAAALGWFLKERLVIDPQWAALGVCALLVGVVYLAILVALRIPAEDRALLQRLLQKLHS